MQTLILWVAGGLDGFPWTRKGETARTVSFHVLREPPRVTDTDNVSITTDDNYTKTSWNSIPVPLQCGVKGSVKKGLMDKRVGRRPQYTINPCV